MISQPEPPRRQQMICRNCGLILASDLRRAMPPSRLRADHRFDDKCPCDLVVLVWRDADSRSRIDVDDLVEQMELF